MHPTAQRLQERLHELGLEVEIRELSDSTRTAQEAADAVGAELGQIVKSLVFMERDTALLCLCACDRRVDTTKLGEDVRQAKCDEGREATGFAIGGVPPLRHERPVRTVLDESLRRFETFGCAGGTPHAAFAVDTDRLVGASAASAQTHQNGLVNLNLDNITVQVPIGVAANVCDVNVAVLANLVDLGQATPCTALANTDASAVTVGAPSPGSTTQNGLVNVNLSNITVQVPIAAAVNICDVNAAVLASLANTAGASCDATAHGHANH